ncbi:FecCD family ABC transporter permease [Streptococcus ictaluri]|uniref:FecCD family ABC transporter permease n=1 Tax=Streptococcus ictaluri TaxID=380397 RepID=UPI001F3F1A1D|nr:iron ABC transporter permease [Streptococcus ictaluri]
MILISSSLLLALYCNSRFGAISISNRALLHLLLTGDRSSRLATIFWTIRLPRQLAAALVGAALAVSGAIMQGLTRNPIADPGILGIQSGAGLALVLGYAFFPHLHYSAIMALCLTGSTLSALLVFGLAHQRGRGYQQMRLILAGAMVSLLLSALGQALTNYFHLANAIIGWQAGGLVGVNWKMLTYIAPLILIALSLAYLFSYQLTILSLSDNHAKALGQKTFLITSFFMLLVLVLASAAVAIAGSIAFVGLIIPHLIKPYSAKNYRQMIPLTGLLGASFMLWVDFACRNINPPYETPLSALVSLIGLPCFLWLVKKGGSS